MIDRLARRIGAIFANSTTEAPRVEEPVSPSVPISASLVPVGMEGIDILSARGLVEANRQTIIGIVWSFGDQNPAKGFHDTILELIFGAAEWMGPIPMPHIPGRQEAGGLFAHSLQVGMTALALSRIQNPPKTPYLYYDDPDAADLAWQLLALTCGLLRDSDKLGMIGRVQAISVRQDSASEEDSVQGTAANLDTIWLPMEQDFYAWVRAHKVLSYHIDGDAGSHDAREGLWSQQMVARVPPKLRNYFYTAHRMVFEQYDAFAGDPASISDMPIFLLLQTAKDIAFTHARDAWWKERPADLAPRIIESFAEFAAGIQWNRPDTAFIHAAVECGTGMDAQHYFLPFFVATRKNIAALREHMSEHCSQAGMPDEDQFESRMFGLLERAGVMHRTVRSMLPDQKTFLPIPDHIPASLARVLFDPVGSGDAEARLEQVLVIPVSLRVPSHAHENIPTLAFIADLTSPDPIVPFRVAIERREREKERRQLSLGPIRRIETVQSLDPRQEASHPTAPSASKPVLPSPHVTPPDLAASRKPDDSSEDHTAKPNEPRNGGTTAKGVSSIMPWKASAHPHRTLDDRLIEPEAGNLPDDMWIAPYKATLQTPAPAGRDYRRMFWASVWLFFYKAQTPKCQALKMATGHYAFLGRFLSNATRTAYSAALREHDLDLSTLSQFWTVGRISPEAPRVVGLFEERRDAQRRAVIRLDYQTGEIISEILNATGIGH